jgi:glutaminase
MTNELRTDMELRNAVDSYLNYIKKTIETQSYQSAQWDDIIVKNKQNSVKVAAREPLLKVQKGKKFCSYIVKNDGENVKRGDILGRTFLLNRPSFSKVLGNVLEKKYATA